MKRIAGLRFVARGKEPASPRHSSTTHTYVANGQQWPNQTDRTPSTKVAVHANISDRGTASAAIRERLPTGSARSTSILKPLLHRSMPFRILERCSPGWTRIENRSHPHLLDIRLMHEAILLSLSVVRASEEPSTMLVHLNEHHSRP